MIRLLVADDSALMRKLLGGIFAAEGDFEVAFARNGREAIEAHARFVPDVVTLDVTMPELDGLACLDAIMQARPCPVVMLSSLTAEGAEVSLDALARGAVDVIAKPAGAVSLDIDRLAPLIVRKVRAAAGARPRRRPRPAAVASPARPPAPASAAGEVAGLVLVGTSTGGPPALEALLGGLPADFPWPVVVAQHMPARFTASLARRLDGLCALTVAEVSHPMPLARGHVYLGQGDADVIVARRPAGLVAAPAPAHPDHPWHPSVDRLVASALDLLPPSRLVGVLMTGMGRDGAAAMTELHRRGGRTLAEAEETAVVWGMPGELVRAGGAGRVAPLDAIAAELAGLIR